MVSAGALEHQDQSGSNVADAVETQAVSHLACTGRIGPAWLRPCGSAGALLREACAKHVLEDLEGTRRSGHLARLAKQHRSELRRGMTAYLRRQLVAAKPDPFRGSQTASSACGDSPRSARSLASSRAGMLSWNLYAHSFITAGQWLRVYACTK